MGPFHFTILQLSGSKTPQQFKDADLTVVFWKTIRKSRNYFSAQAFGHITKSSLLKKEEFQLHVMSSCPNRTGVSSIPPQLSNKYAYMIFVLLGATDQL